MPLLASCKSPQPPQSLELRCNQFRVLNLAAPVLSLFPTSATNSGKQKHEKYSLTSPRFVVEFITKGRRRVRN